MPVYEHNISGVCIVLEELTPTLVNPVTLGTVQFGRISDVVAALQKVGVANLRSCLKTNGGSVSRIINHCANFHLPNFHLPNHTKNVISGHNYSYKSTLKSWFGTVRTDQYME